MKKAILILTVALIALTFTSCSNKEEEKSVKQEVPIAVVKKETPKVSETTNTSTSELLSKIDTSKVKTFDDYYTLEQKLFNEYYNLEQSAFSDYYTKEQSALMVIREKHYAKYLEWLDAKKMNDFEKLMAIESSPEFAKYVLVKKTEYKKYKENKKSLYKAYEQIKKISYKEYAQKKASAYQAYQKKN